jgi:hypothetical protein
VPVPWIGYTKRDRKDKAHDKIILVNFRRYQNDRKKRAARIYRRVPAANGSAV